ncbi:MAG: amidohydrolase family protein [Bacteroidales bacterium]
MRKLSAHYIFPIDAPPIQNGVITLNDAGVVVELSQMQGEEEGVEFYNGILVPGFVNAHCHLELSNYKGATPKGIGLANFLTKAGSLNRNVEKQHVQQSMLLADAQMYQSGTVAVGDISNSTTSFEVKKNSAIYYHTFVEPVRLWKKEANKYFALSQQVLSDAQAMGLSASLCAHALYSTLSDWLKRIAQSSQLFSLHFLESEDEHLFFDRKGGIYNLFHSLQSTVIDKINAKEAWQYLEIAMPYLCKLLLVHNTFVSPTDVDFINQYATDTCWVLCPRSNLYIEGKLPPIEMLRVKGVQIALGTDSLMSNDNLLIIDELKAMAAHFAHISLNEMLCWATLNGAKALNMDNELGSFTIGKKPQVVQLSHVNLQNMQLTENSTSRLITKK